MKHMNSGDCDKCNQLFDLYPGFNLYLKNWFKNLQLDNPEVHISCASRGREAQERAFQNGSSKAQFGQSPHNYGCAIDIFRLLNDTYDLWPKWFEEVIKPNIPIELFWYGEINNKTGKPVHDFYELPHIEVRNWKSLDLKPVEKLI